MELKLNIALLHLFVPVPVQLCCSERFLFLRRMTKDRFFPYIPDFERLRCHDRVVFLLDFQSVGSVVSQGLSVPLFGGL